MRTYYIFTINVMLLICVTVANAQIGTDNFFSATSDRAMNTNYYYARPNEITIVVSIIGFVQRPGRYEIATSIDLMNLISLAGGPTGDGALSKVKIIRILEDGEKTRDFEAKTNQEILSSFLKEEIKMTRREIEIDLTELSSVKSEELQLMPGDIVVVDRTTWSNFRDAFGVAVSAAVITTAIVQVITASRR